VIWKRAYLTGTVALSLCAAVAAAPASHDVAFWRAIVRGKYALPNGSDVPALAGELTDMLASADPELRDEIAYSTLASWIYQQKILNGEALRPLTERLIANLRVGIGERDTDSVFRRSFSALVLSVVIARDNADPFLEAGEWRRVEQAALDYFAAEQDVRGYEFEKGWLHSAAHTADLLKFLGRSRYLDAPGQTRFLNAIGQKLVTSPVVFTHGEDERFARALLSLVNRKDFDPAQFTEWLGEILSRSPVGARESAVRVAREAVKRLAVNRAVVWSATCHALARRVSPERKAEASAERFARLY